MCRSMCASVRTAAFLPLHVLDQRRDTTPCRGTPIATLPSEDDCSGYGVVGAALQIRQSQEWLPAGLRFRHEEPLYSPELDSCQLPRSPLSSFGDGGPARAVALWESAADPGNYGPPGEKRLLLNPQKADLFPLVDVSDRSPLPDSKAGDLGRGTRTRCAVALPRPCRSAFHIPSRSTAFTTRSRRSLE